MHECCTVPIDQMMANEHKPDGVCCLVSEVTEAPPRADCSESGTSSRKIQHRTVEHLVKHEQAGEIVDTQYYYCAEPDCSVVYFAGDGVRSFTTDDLKVKVFAKDPGGDVNVCYCYDWTRDRIKSELAETGRSSASREIAEKVRASLCECDIKNPKGTCCLGDVNRAVREAKEALAAEQ